MRYRTKRVLYILANLYTWYEVSNLPDGKVTPLIFSARGRPSVHAICLRNVRFQLVLPVILYVVHFFQLSFSKSDVVTLKE